MERGRARRGGPVGAESVGVAAVEEGRGRGEVELQPVCLSSAQRPREELKQSPRSLHRFHYFTNTALVHLLSPSLYVWF